MVNESSAVPPVNVTSIDILPEPLKRVRELAKSQLAAIFANMFDSADDTLFELADKATSNIDQTMYFDSMRQVRIQRQGMESVFMQKVQDGFRQLFLSVDNETADPEKYADGMETLALVCDDDLEESVAIRGMVSKVVSQCDVSLSELTQRINYLVRAKTITDLSNPLGPHRLCEAFREAAGLLELDIRAKLVVYKLFEKYVLGVIGKLYNEANGLLIERGVLPSISSNAKQRSATKRVSGSRQPIPPPTANSQEDSEIFNFLRGLLTDSQFQSKNTGPTLPVADQGPALAHGDLVELLSSIQQQKYETGNLVNFRAEQIDVRQALYNLLEQSGSALQNRAIGKVDNDVINLVSMLFEFILDDHNLSSPMKALLARLQIPLLKVAVLDKTFFSRGGHPARKLLNELATAAMGWSETVDLKRDTLYVKVKAIVDSVLDDFVDDVSIFQNLLEDFTDFIGIERRRAELIEQRTRDAEEGLGKTQYARSVVGDVLNQKAQGTNLPPVVIELLRDGWSSYLFLVHVKEGVESQAWEDALATVDDLIWSVQPAADKSYTSQLLKLIPSLLQRLRKGLTSISFSKVKMRNLFKELESIHLNCLKSSSLKPAVKPETDDDAVAQEFTTLTRTEPEPKSLANAPGDTQKSAQVISKSTIESPVIITNAELPVIEQAISATEGDEYLNRVDGLTSGTWVELIKEDKKQRAKLVAVIRSTGKYIFVNRVGMKVAEKTRTVLAQELREGLLNILDDTLLFDRALESVIGHLREMKD